MNIWRFIGRVWFYFRMGYSTYLTFILGYASTLVTVYYLAIKNIPDLLSIFPRFVPFAAIATVVGVPLSVSVGWAHYKRSTAFSSEIDIQYEANPYFYKFPPGFNKEVVGPVYLEMLSLLKKICELHQPLTIDEKQHIDALEQKLRTLNAGGMVGSPRRKV